MQYCRGVSIPCDLCTGVDAMTFVFVRLQDCRDVSISCDLCRGVDAMTVVFVMFDGLVDYSKG